MSTDTKTETPKRKRPWGGIAVGALATFLVVGTAGTTWTLMNQKPKRPTKCARMASWPIGRIPVRCAPYWRLANGAPNASDPFAAMRDKPVGSDGRFIDPFEPKPGK